jgi:hypothetical protein
MVEMSEFNMLLSYRRFISCLFFPLATNACEPWLAPVCMRADTHEIRVY